MPLLSHQTHFHLSVNYFSFHCSKMTALNLPESASASIGTSAEQAKAAKSCSQSLPTVTILIFAPFRNFPTAERSSAQAPSESSFPQEIWSAEPLCWEPAVCSPAELSGASASPEANLPPQPPTSMWIAA